MGNCQTVALSVNLHQNIFSPTDLLNHPFPLPFPSSPTETKPYVSGLHEEDGLSFGANEPTFFTPPVCVSSEHRWAGVVTIQFQFRGIEYHIWHQHNTYHLCGRLIVCDKITAVDLYCTYSKSCLRVAMSGPQAWGVKELRGWTRIWNCSIYRMILPWWFHTKLWGCGATMKAGSRRKISLLTTNLHFLDTEYQAEEILC